MATAAMPRGGVDARPVPPARPSGSAAPAAGSAEPASGSAAPAAGSAALRSRFAGTLTRAQQIAAVTIVVFAVFLAGIGLYLSFEHVASYAHTELRFQSLGKARLFTVGVDVGILVLIAVDLLMAWLGRPIRWLRYPVWFLTGATIVLNAASAAPPAGAWQGRDYVAVFAHAVVPVLFITVVEVGKTAIERAVRPADGAERPGVPLHRWLLSPAPTFALWRRMRLWAVPTYQEAVQREQALKVYRVHLERKYGRRWKRKAPADLQLPLTMAAYGLTIEEALDLPRQAEEREASLTEAQEAAKVAAENRKADREADARIARLRTAGRVQAAEQEVSTATEQAAITSRAELVAAERAAEAETAARESATAAEADARRAAAEKQAAADRKAAAELTEHAAEQERRNAEQAQRAAELLALKAEQEQRAATARAAEKQAAADAAELEERAAERRLRTAELERRAAELEDEAGLSKPDRAARKVARMALADHGGQVDALPLETVMDAFTVSKTTASAYRSAAEELIRDGYRPGEAA